MGKYMRKCRGATGEVAAMEVTQVVGVRTRSRATAAAITTVASKRRKTAAAPAVEPVANMADNDGSCYLQLRSRRLFMAAVAPPRTTPRPEVTNSGAAAAPVAAVSRCSSTASSVDVMPQEKSLECRGEPSAAFSAEAGEDRDLESSVSDSGSGRERRETTPSSQPRGGLQLSDLESEAGRKHHRRYPATTAAAATISAVVMTRMPPVAEIEEFFAAAEKAQAERFAVKYNFDVVRGVPLDSGRFEWAPVVSS